MLSLLLRLLQLLLLLLLLLFYPLVLEGRKTTCAFRGIVVPYPTPGKWIPLPRAEFRLLAAVISPAPEADTRV